MKKSGALLLAIASLAVALSSDQPPARSADQPPARVALPDVRLVLLVVVDQFRYDYLTRFRNDYTDGLRQLLTEGAVFTDANLEHYPTVTAVGHSTMLSGATPAVSGIIGNDWFDRETGKPIESVEDPRVKPLGSPTGGTASPRRLLVTTLGDELKIASAFQKGSPGAPRVFGISLKDRGAILPAGRAADAAYWWDDRTGNFVTSTYYVRDLPAWVTAFNARKAADKYAGAAWTMFSAPSTVLRQMPLKPGAALYEAVWASPFGNDVLLAFAEQLLEHEQVGVRGVTDVLSISFSSNDSIGHNFGPDSPQVRDIAIRTDRTLGQLLRRIDKVVGLQRTVVAFTTDHGVAPLPESLLERALPGGRITTTELFSPIQQALASRFGEGRWFLATAGSSPYVNYALIDQLKLDPAEVRRVAAEAAMKVPHVARVYTRDQLLRGDVGVDRFASRVLRGFNAQRSGDLEILLEPYWMRRADGTTHGSPYNYDTHIPLILMGRQIKPGFYSDHVALNDLAPTLATLVNVEIPGGSSGRVLTEALRPAESLRPSATASR